MAIFRIFAIATNRPTADWLVRVLRTSGSILDGENVFTCLFYISVLILGLNRYLRVKILVDSRKFIEYIDVNIVELYKQHYE